MPSMTPEQRARAQDELSGEHGATFLHGHHVSVMDEDEGQVRGCSCGMADYGAPGHEGHADYDAAAAEYIRRVHARLAAEEAAAAATAAARR